MCAVAALALAGGGLLLAVPAGALAYLVACLVFGVFSLGEVTRVRAALQRGGAPASSVP
jgi:hypothetical protein